MSGSIYRSPVFTYDGAGGKGPDNLKFRMSRRADLNALLSVAGSSATYSVSMERVGGGSSEAVEIVEPTSMAGAEEWTAIDPVSVDPALLDIGSKYRMVITSVFENGAQVIESGSVGYDNVTLRAMKRGGGGTVSEKQLIKIIKVALPGSVTISGGSAKTKLKCQRAAGTKCKFRGLKLVADRTAQTKQRKAAVRAGTKRTVGMKLKGPANARTLKRRGKAVLKGRITVGGKSRKISREVKVRVR